MPTHVISVMNRAALKATPGSGDNVIITTGLNTKGDGGGKLYYWDATSTASEDLINNNVVSVTGMATGRYLAVFTRIIELPHGTLFINNGKKEFFTKNAVVSNIGDCLVYLTYENTATGTPIFNDVKFNDSKAIVDTTSANDAVSSCQKSLSADLKQLRHIFFRGNSLTVVLGLLLSSFRNAAQGTPVVFKVEGT